LALGLLVFEDLPTKIVFLAVFSNVLYLISVRDFPVITVLSPSFLLACGTVNFLKLEF